MHARIILLVALFAGLAGCHCGATNPSFPVTIAEANADLKRMEADQKPLDRPLVGVTGWLDLGAAGAMSKHLRRIHGEDGWIVLRMDDIKTTAEGRQKLIDAVNEKWPSDDPARTVEVDCIGFSMGGIITRTAADPSAGDVTLDVVNMYTIVTPHIGSPMAHAPLPDSKLADMRFNSELLNHLNNEVERDYELVCYARLCDHVVNAPNTAPPGMRPWWVNPVFFTDAHVDSIKDQRILADLSRRLRNEEPFTTYPPAPLPSGDRRNKDEQLQKQDEQVAQK